MFEFSIRSASEIAFSGRLDASQTDKASQAFETVGGQEVIVDLSELEYISSAGLGVLLLAQKRLKAMDSELILIHPRPQIMNLFSISGFNKIFTIR